MIHEITYFVPDGQPGTPKWRCTQYEASLATVADPGPLTLVSDLTKLACFVQAGSYGPNMVFSVVARNQMPVLSTNAFTITFPSTWELFLAPVTVYAKC
jgi:hypothetical protein